MCRENGRIVQKNAILSIFPALVDWKDLKKRKKNSAMVFNYKYPNYRYSELFWKMKILKKLSCQDWVITDIDNAFYSFRG